MGDAGLAMLDHRDLVFYLSCDASELLAVSEHLEEVVMTQNPVETQTLTPISQGCTVLPVGNSVSLDLGMTGQMVQVASLSDHCRRPLSLTLLWWVRLCGLHPTPPHSHPTHLLLKSGLAGTGPRFPLASQPFSGLPGVPSGFAPPVFPTLPIQPQVQSVGPGGAYPLLATGSVRPVISLLSLQPRSAVVNPPPPFSTGPSQLPLGGCF